MKIVRLFSRAKWFAILSVSVFTILNTAIFSQSLRGNIHPKITMENTGKFVIVWESESKDSGYYNIKARGYYANGTERFEEITVNTVLDGQHRRPDVAMYYGEDNFAVVWEDDSDDDGSYDIKIRGFTSNGTELFAEKRVNTVVDGQQRNPAIAVSIYGSFVVAWEDDRDSIDVYQIYMRGFYPNGSEIFTERIVNSLITGQHKKPSVSKGADGTLFSVVWEDDSDDDENYNIYAKGFWRGGATSFSEVLVNTITSGQQTSPATSQDLFPTGSSNFVVAWADDNDNNNIF